MDYRLQQLDILIDLHNQERNNRWFWKGKPLVKNHLLMKQAQKFVNKLAANEYLIKDDKFDYKELGFSIFGQNIGCGKNSPEKILEYWLSVPCDKDNILKTKFTDIGCGMSLSQSGKLYWCVLYGG